MPTGGLENFFAKDFFSSIHVYTLFYSSILMILQCFTTNHLRTLHKAINYLNTNDRMIFVYAILLI